MSGSAAAPGARPAILRLLAAVGEPTVAAARWTAFVAGLGAAVAAAAVRVRNWRRPVRLAFMLMLYEGGVRALPAVMVAAVLVGIGMVFQALFWLGSVGQETLVGPLLTTVLVREVAPVVVGLLLVGRSGTTTLVVLGAHLREGRFAAVDAQGIDPLLLFVMPRVAASAVAGLCLSIIFVGAALLAGWLVSWLLSPVGVGLLDLLSNVLRAMGPSNFILLPLKGVLIGLVVSLVACAVVFGAPGLAAQPHRLLPHGFAVMVVATLVVSGLVSMVL
ncbi:MAG: ABC transporter permease [Acetobacteraceae bacterium]|jgi:phospholipid/cholesterol/gamma-HCH transport system permease protein|nr:ABC transporter permease [Acetobacteraceae bacterium]